MRVQVVTLLAVLLAVLQFTSAAGNYYSGYPSDRTMKRSALLQPENNPEWNQLGWAWGKRSAGMEIPHRAARALHPVKKNPDWQDLGFAWGRK
ncbi:Neuropeptide CCHamide-1 [Caenorhabditis elegans]|uniref:Neuropeptide CCHamide-1 n=1 Tax=Caenorhabditis elegans TaxID=6239 RepID=Q95ZI9_CAEEL|nr:Neuropeptide CCHamide-1 [Caenorhabditis elegans]CAC42383.1 Neuropeptide CCHamide-1 [Caenorhabditis elegans]|eukprot:NP_507687.1 Neuropeptide-Like Protein [Caenorhabditis elegans]